MGLDIVPLKRSDDDRVSFSYDGFGEFRRRLAAAVGIDLDQMRGFGGEQREWPDPKDEPLVYLLNHSDCEGMLDYEACEALAPRLYEVVAKCFPARERGDEVLTPESWWYHERGIALADACAKVAKGEYEELMFS